MELLIKRITAVDYAIQKKAKRRKHYQQNQNY